MRIRVLLSAILAVACNDVTAPSTKCVNPLEPPAFRLVHQAMFGLRLDTSAVLVNRYLEPHRPNDTTWTDAGPFQIAVILKGPPGYCVTLFDSVAHHDTLVVTYIPVKP